MSGPPSLIELRSNGGAGEAQGSRLGLYQLMPDGVDKLARMTLIRNTDSDTVYDGGEVDRQGPVYQQLHNTNQEHIYLYRWDIALHTLLQANIYQTAIQLR